MIYERLSNAPNLVRNFCFVHSAFIVGSAAEYVMGDRDSCRDWDIIVPLSNWSFAQKSIPKNSLTNTFGGIKIVGSDFQIDVWSQDLSNYLNNNLKDTGYILHPSSNYCLKMQKRLEK